MKLVYLFTTFPVHSETFLQREIREVSKHFSELSIHSIWGGKTAFEGKAIKRFSLWELARLFIELPRWCLKKPQALCAILEEIYSSKIPNLKNLGETLLGLGFGVVKAQAITSQEKATHIHAVWATMPTTAAWVIWQLTGQQYSMGAHAYDVFEDGGDCLLAQKIKEAAFVHTSTESTQKHLRAISGDTEKIVLIRRGLNTLPAFKTSRPTIKKIRFLSVGRLVEKKGYQDQLALYSVLKQAGIPFEAKIVGQGPLENTLKASIEKRGLDQAVTLLGQLGFETVSTEYQWADAFIFTGKISKSGDRDGLPNVIPEAMASGLPVMTTPVSGTTEAIKQGETGFIIERDQPQAFLSTVEEIIASGPDIETMRLNARTWVETHFIAHKNSQKLVDIFRESHEAP